MTQTTTDTAAPALPPRDLAPQPSLSVCSAYHGGFVEELRCQLDGFGEHEFEAGGHGKAIDRRDHRYVGFHESTGDLLNAATIVGHGVSRDRETANAGLVLHAFEVATGTKGPITNPFNQHRANLWIGGPRT